MSIQFREQTGIISLETAHTLYQMKADATGVLLHLYYGKKTGGDMEGEGSVGRRSPFVCRDCGYILAAPSWSDGTKKYSSVPRAAPSFLFQRAYVFHAFLH